MDWFRWHHGSVNDPKFQLVAKRSSSSVAEVIAVWACLLEAASMAETRGEAGIPDFEALECALGLEEGQATRIYTAMQAREILNIDGAITSWEKRQPKREREDNTAADRKRAQREREANGSYVGVTPSHAMSHQKQPRVDKSREEDKDIFVASGDLPSPQPQAVIDLYHEVLEELPRVRLMDDKRKKAIGSFWRWVLTSEKDDGVRRAKTADQALTWIRAYFERARDNDFLMGRTGRTGEHAKWQCDLDFLLTDKGKKHVIEKTKENA